MNRKSTFEKLVEDPSKEKELIYFISTYPHYLYIEGESSPLTKLKNRGSFDCIKELLKEHLEKEELFPIYRDLHCEELAGFLPRILTNEYELDYLLGDESVETVGSFWKLWVNDLNNSCLSHEMDIMWENPGKFLEFVRYICPTAKDLYELVRTRYLYLGPLDFCRKLIGTGYRASSIEFYDLLSNESIEPGRFRVFYPIGSVVEPDIPENLSYNQLILLWETGYRKVLVPNKEIICGDLFRFLLEFGMDLLVNWEDLFKYCLKSGGLDQYIQSGLKVPKDACELVYKSKEMTGRERGGIMSILESRGADPYKDKVPVYTQEQKRAISPSREKRCISPKNRCKSPEPNKRNI
jgi:hypothetical protein